MDASKVPNKELAEAGVALLRQNGIAVEKIESSGRSMIYRRDNGETVRIRTCNDHILVVLADSPDEDARLNIENTDHLLIVMPEVPRTRGNVLAYFVPTDVAISAVRSSRKQWLASNPSTNGQNRTWNIWFNDDGPKSSNGFGEKWAGYRLSSKAENPKPLIGQKLGDVIADARSRIAAAAGVSESSVKISIDIS